MMSKTMPNQQDTDLDDAEYAKCLENWARPAADRFGTWHDWTQDQIDYLLEELRLGFLADAWISERSSGGTVAAMGMLIAQAGHESYGEDCVARILDALDNGLRVAIDNAANCEEEGFEAGDACETAEELMSVLIDATQREVARPESEPPRVWH